MCVFLRLVEEMRCRVLEQGINTEFCVKFRKNARENCTVLFEAYGGEELFKKSNVF